VRVRCVSQGSAVLDKSLRICRVPDQVCRVPEIRHSAKPFPKKGKQIICRVLAQRALDKNILCRVPGKGAHGKELFLNHF